MAVDFSKKFEGLGIGSAQARENLFGKTAISPQQEVSEVEIDKVLPFPQKLLPVDCREMFDDYSDEDMEELTESIKKHGVLQPVLLRISTENPGFYELLAGHHRLEGARRVGLKAIPCRIRKADDDIAISIFVETNLNQRKHLSWKTMAFAYQMDLAALSHQGKRTDLQSDEEYEEGVKRLETAAGKSKRTIFQIARLTKLHLPFFELLEKKKIPFTAAYHLSFLQKPEQAEVYELLQDNPDAELVVAGAEELHRISEIKGWNRSAVRAALKLPSEKHPDMKSQPVVEKPVTVRIPSELYQKYFPDLKPKEAGEKLMEILDGYFNTNAG